MIRVEQGSEVTCVLSHFSPLMIGREPVERLRINADFSLDAKPRTRSVDVPEKKEKEDDWWVRSLVKIDCVSFKLIKVNNLQNLLIGRGQYNRWCATSIESLQPTIGADAPLITGF